jgi:hypothetical protein
MTQETLWWKLFPFSLIERAEQWYTHNIESVNGDWVELRVDFCYSFSLLNRINSLPFEILDFKQIEKESIGAAWARFLRLLASLPDMPIPDDVSLYIFCSCLDMDAALDLNIAAGGSFAHKNPMEGRKFLDSLLENSSSRTNHNEPRRKESKSSHESPSKAKSEPLSSSSSIKFKPLPTGLHYVVLDDDRETTVIFLDESLEMENRWAMESSEALTLESEKRFL